MTSTSKKSIRTYLKTIRKKLPCSISIRTAIIQDLKQTILANEACQEWTFDKLQEEFGTPDEIAVGFSNGSLNDHLRKKSTAYTNCLYYLRCSLYSAYQFSIVCIS